MVTPFVHQMANKPHPLNGLHTHCECQKSVTIFKGVLHVRFICCEYLAREKVNLVCFFQAHRYIFILPDVTKISNAVAKCSVYIQIHLHYINNTLTYNFLQSNVVNYFKSMAKFTYTWLVCQYADPHAIFVIGQFYRSFCSFIGNGRKIFRVNWRHEFYAILRKRNNEVRISSLLVPNLERHSLIHSCFYHSTGNKQPVFSEMRS